LRTSFLIRGTKKEIEKLSELDKKADDAYFKCKKIVKKVAKDDRAVGEQKDEIIKNIIKK